MSGRCVIVGSINQDLVTRVPRIPEPGETIHGFGFSTGAGGKGLNQAIAAARMPGASVLFVGAVGSDAFGRELTGALQDAGVNTGHVRTLDTCATGTASIFVSSDGENCIALAAGANSQVSADQVSEAHGLISEAQVVALQLEIAPAATLRAAELGHAAGAVVVLTPAPAPSLPDEEAEFRELVSHCSLLVPNETELRALVPDELAHDADVSAIARAAAAACVAWQVPGMIVTCGARGVVIVRQGECPDGVRDQLREAGLQGGVVSVDGADDGSTVPHAWAHLTPPPLDRPVVDTTGAGDALAGTLAAQIACCGSGAEHVLGRATPALQDLISAARWGCAAAALSVTGQGASTSYADVEAVRALVQSS